MRVIDPTPVGEPPSKTLLRIEGLVKQFPLGGGLWGAGPGVVRAVDGVTFQILEGETLGLVGESGSGKSTTGRLILRLLEPTAGRVFFDGRDLFALPRPELRALRQQMQIVFQDPYGSLNPRMTVGQAVMEGLAARGRASRRVREADAAQLLDMVGLRPEHRSRYPHEFSGGQRQRIGIARALAPGPRFLVADEPVSALDVSVQAQVLNLMLELQQRLSLTLLFIAHDLAVVRHVSDRIAVMYLGRIVELADNLSIYEAPLHPYTRTLLAAIPIPEPGRRTVAAAPAGEPAGQMDRPTGCAFRARCPYAAAACAEPPPLREVRPGHFAACHFAESLPGAERAG